MQVVVVECVGQRLNNSTSSTVIRSTPRVVRGGDCRSGNRARGRKNNWNSLVAIFFLFIAAHCHDAATYGALMFL